MKDNAFEALWEARHLGDLPPTVFPILLATRTVQKEDPPKIGPMDTQLLWFEVEVQLVIGGEKIGEAVRFPADEPLSAQTAFVAVMKAVLEHE